MLKYDWALVNLHIDNLILLRNGWNNTRFLCIKVDLRVLSGSSRLLLPADGPGLPYAGRWCRTGGSKLYKGLGDLCNIFILRLVHDPIIWGLIPILRVGVMASPP